MNLTCEKQEGLNIWKRGIYSINISIVTCTVNKIILIIYLMHYNYYYQIFIFYFTEQL